MRQPNILIIYTDQQRWDAIGANGNPHIITPNLDRLAGSGVTFDHHFVQNPVCMPSRVSMLSGQYPSTLGITHMGVPVPEDLPTLPHFLKRSGYKTANIGKLHFLPHANRDHRETHPAYGFDHLAISDEPGVYEDVYRAWARRKLIATGRDLSQMDHLSLGLPPARAIWRDVMDVQDPVKHPGEGGRSDFIKAIPFGADDDLTHSAFVGEQTVEYLRAQDGKQPFLCIAGFYSPHAPWVVPQRYLDQYDPAALPLPDYPPGTDRPDNPDERYSEAQLRSAKHGYYAMITEVDHYVGQILDALEQNGLAENTIVVFTSDHGEWLGDHLRYGKGYPGDDAVSRVPLIIRAPGVAAEGIKAEALVEAVDIVPTLLDLAGMQLPPHLQGRSLGDFLRRPEGAFRESALMEGTGWKNLRTARHRYLIHADGRETLYDLENDPGEYNDVAGNHPQVLAECRQMLLQRLLEQERPLKRIWTY